MKKPAIGLLVILAGIAATALAIVPAMTHTALADCAQSFDGSAAAASGPGPAICNGGSIAICDGFVAVKGACATQ